MKEEIFINTIWPQKYGEYIKILKGREKRIGGKVYYECEFQKYSYKKYHPKSAIISGEIVNPQIEQEEFINKIWHKIVGMI